MKGLTMFGTLIVTGIALVALAIMAGLVQGNTTIPRNTKAADLAWGKNFVNALESDPAAYNVDVADVNQLRVLIDDFEVKWDAFGVTNRIANEPGSYTQPGRSELATAHSNFLGMASQIAFKIHADNSISDGLKDAAGVALRNFNRDPIPAPSTQPVLGLVAANVGVHQLEFEDATTPGSKRKPFGVTHVLLFGQVHDVGATPDVNEAKLIAPYSKNPLVVTHDSGDNGKEITYWAQYVTQRGLKGPMSGSTTHTIMF